MKQNDPQMRIRLPADVKSWLEREAEKNVRTQNAEIVVAIRAKMATTGNEIGVMAPAEAGNSSNQEKADAERA